MLRPQFERMALSLAILGAAGAPDVARYQALRGVVGAQRNWAHLVQLLAGGGMLASISPMIAVAKPLYGGWLFWKPNVGAAAVKAG